MRYISVYAKNNFLRNLFIMVSVLAVVLPGAALIWPMLADPASQSEDQWINVLITVGACMIAPVVMIIVFKNLKGLSVEVTDMGIQHLAPGRERTILWQEVTEAKIVPYGKNQQAVRIKSPQGRYVFPPHMVPDSFDAPALKMGFPFQYWLYPDGRRERADAAHSFGAKVVRQYRPELATGKLELKDTIKI